MHSLSPSLSLASSLVVSPTLIPCHISVLWITVFEIDSKCNTEPLKRGAATRAFFHLSGTQSEFNASDPTAEFALDPDTVAEPQTTLSASLLGSMFSQAMKKWVQGNTDEVGM